MQVNDDDDDHDKLGDFGLDYYTELTAQYVTDMAESRLIETEVQSDRNVVWFLFDDVEMSVSVYPDAPAICVGADTRIPFHSFQENAAWILRTCADFGVGIDLDVDKDTGETWMFIFLRIFWAGYNYEVLSAACEDLVQCRKALETRLPLDAPPRKRDGRKPGR
jgi:hypothetical protein